MADRADTDGTVFFNDTDELTVGTVTENASAGAMTISGITGDGTLGISWSLFRPDARPVATAAPNPDQLPV